jgi:hypothetical protein
VGYFGPVLGFEGILLVLEVWGISVILELLGVFVIFLGYFAHFSGLGVFWRF